MSKILIIGGGVAGLSAGIYAQLSGYQATVCERHSVAGGNLTGWQRGAYHIDNCIHWLTGTNPNTDTYRMWTELGALGDVDIYQAETLYTCERDGKRLSLHKDLDTLQKEMLKLSPADEKEINALIKAVKAIQGLCGVAGEDHDHKSELKEQLFTLPPLLRYYRLSAGELSEKFLHPLLKDFLACLVGKQFTSIALLTVFAIFCGENGGLPAGGSLAMAQRMAKRFTDLGGELLLNKEAERIILRNNKAVAVSFTDGTYLRADYIVSTADPKITFEKLLQRELPREFKKQYDNPKLLRFSSYHTAFSCDVAELPFSGDLIFRLNEKQKKKLHTEFLILREFSHEPSFAPKGKNVLQTLTFCNEDAAKEFIELRKDKAAYKQKKQELAETVEEILAKKFPQFKDKLKCIDVWTPATYARYTGAETGSYMSFLLPEKYIPHRLKSEIKDLPNVVLATQWQQAPGGLPTAADLGKCAIACIERKEARLARAHTAKLSIPRPKRKSKA